MRNAIKVLIVDDDRSSANLLAEVVKRMGLKPIVVSKPADGLNVVKLQTVHAAIVDVLLPKMSGVDLAMDFRKTKFAENPIILVSGVFKDKVFKEDAVKKCGAADFLFKPFGPEDLQNSLKNALSAVMSTEKMSVHSLLVRRFSSPREPGKAIEQLDQVRGHEFPFVLSILMDAKLSGHLNIANDAGEIFGVTLSRGMIAEVDGTDSQATAVLALISNGFLAQDDWDGFQKQGKGKKRFPLERLVQEGLVSPHAVAVAKHEQILYDFKAICSAQTMQLNFVPQEGEEDVPKHAVSLKELLRLLAASMDEFFPNGYLAEFFSPVKDSSIHLLCPPEHLEPVWGSKLFASLTGLRKAVEGGGSLESALKAHPKQEAHLYKCLHYLVLSRKVIFDDVQQTKALNQLAERLNQIYAELNGKPPDKVFEYIGGVNRPSPAAAEKMLLEYEQSNAPSALPKGAPADLVDLARRCHELVRAAAKVMTDEVKRAEIFQAAKQESAQKAKRANELVAQGLELLRKGQFAQSIEILQQAEQINASSLQFAITAWAKVKGNMLTGKTDLLAVARKLEEFPADERKSTYWLMAMGLVKKALGEASAPTYFEKIMQIDNSFLEARRELNAISHPGIAGKELRLNDILTGDISTVVSQLFRTRAK